jgi:hypothetical protein
MPDDDSDEDDEDLFDEVVDETIGNESADEMTRRVHAGGQFGKEFNFKPYLSSLKSGESWEKAKEKAKCAWCDKQPREPRITSCGHLICNEPCFENMWIEMAESDDPDTYPPCKACGKTFNNVHECEISDDDMPYAPAQGTRANAKKNREKDRKRLDREDIAGDWLDLAGKDVLPSAKTIAVKSQIMNWLKENPHVKIIVYTQFLAM